MNNTFRKAQMLASVGSVESALLAYTGRRTTIDQEGQYRIKTVDSPSQKPVPRGTDIEIPLTDVNLDITQMRQMYFQVDVDIQLDLVAGFTGGTLPNLVNATEQQKLLWRRVFIFVGYRHSSDAIQYIKLLHRTRDVSGSEQSRAVLESYLYHRVKPDCELQNRAGTYSLFQDIVNMDVSKCGVYISLYTLAEAFGLGRKIMNIRFPIVVPFDGVLPLEAFSLYPKCTFGDFSLLIKITAELLVVAQVAPFISMTRETRLHHSTISGVHYEQEFLEIANFTSAAALQQRNKYYQIGAPLSLIARVNWTVDADGKVDSVTYTRSDVQFGSTTISAVQIKSHVHGYKIKPRLKEFLKSYFVENLLVVPGEIVRHYSFPNTPNERGIDT
jgi:hypothetical protein